MSFRLLSNAEGLAVFRRDWADSSIKGLIRIPIDSPSAVTECWKAWGLRRRISLWDSLRILVLACGEGKWRLSYLFRIRRHKVVVLIGTCGCIREAESVKGRHVEGKSVFQIPQKAYWMAEGMPKAGFCVIAIFEQKVSVGSLTVSSFWYFQTAHALDKLTNWGF